MLIPNNICTSYTKYGDRICQHQVVPLEMSLLHSGMLFGLVASWIPLAATTDYCSDVQCIGAQHTLCKYPNETPGDECVSVTGQGIDAKQIEGLLHVHNRYRDYVAAGKETRTLGGPMPQAANMGLLTWDEEIARIAQRWALQCHFGHDQCRVLPSMKVGQNVASAGSTARGPPNMTRLAVMWYEKEVGMYSAGGVGDFRFSMSTGHFTQWIWASSYKLGCGYIGFQSGLMNNNFLVCNYGPAGNVVGWPLYRRGAPCSACPEGTACGVDSRYPNLCKADGDQVPRTEQAQFGGHVYSGSAALLHSVLLSGLCSALAASLALLSPGAEREL